MRYGVYNLKLVYTKIITKITEAAKEETMVQFRDSIPHKSVLNQNSQINFANAGRATSIFPLKF